MSNFIPFGFNGICVDLSNSVKIAMTNDDEYGKIAWKINEEGKLLSCEADIDADPPLDWQLFDWTIPVGGDTARSYECDIASIVMQVLTMFKKE